MTTLKIESIHCDRLSVTGNLDWRRTRRKGGESYYDSRTLRDLFNPLNYKISHYPNTDSYLYTDNFSMPITSINSSIFIQVNRRHSGQRDFRADFNPSKLTTEEKAWLIDLLKNIEDKRATRVDLAANFYHDLSDYKLSDGRLRSSVEFKDKYNNLETVYKGSKDSDNYLKMYNKQVEQQAKYKDVDYNWWRIEETIKNSKAHDWTNYDWFRGVQLVTGKASFTDIKAADKAAALAVTNNLMSMNEFSKNYRTKLRKIIDSVTYEGGLNLHETIKKAPYSGMLNSALKEIHDYLQ